MSKVRVSLFLSGNNIPLDDITKKIGILPTKVREKKDWPQSSILAGIAKDTWEFRTDKMEYRDISTQLNEIQTIFGQKTKIIRELIEKYSLSINVIIMIEAEINEYPELILTKENIDFLSSIHAEVGFDLYIDTNS